MQLLVLATLQHTDRQMASCKRTFEVYVSTIFEIEVKQRKLWKWSAKAGCKALLALLHNAEAAPEASVVRWPWGVAEMSPSSVTADPETMALRWSQRGVRDSQKVFSIRKECVILGGSAKQEMIRALEVFSNQSGMKIIRPLLIGYSFIYFMRQTHVF